MDEQDRKRVRRTALWLALLALAFYLGFIALSIFRSH
jgi:uncharacterized membrane protein (DUF485 family)